MNRAELLDTARRLARSLAPGDLDNTLRRITSAAVQELPQVSCASITVRSGDGRLRTVAETVPVLVDVDRKQYELQDGPCYHASVDETFVLAPDLEHDGRWPEYAAVAVAAGLRSQAGFRLYHHPDSVGSLNLYSEEPGAFTDLGELGDLFVHEAVTAIDYAREIEDVKAAARARLDVGQAVGITMERYELTDERAFALLVRTSEHRGVSVHLVAQEILAATEAQGETTPLTT
ncbi:MAG: GAF and ANTAR domain-containing protein [Actinomycetes bacterium]